MEVSFLFPTIHFSMPEMPPDIPPELKEQAELELKLAKRHQLTSSVLLRRSPLRLATACLPYAQLLASLPETVLRCYADGPQNPASSRSRAVQCLAL